MNCNCCSKQIEVERLEALPDTRLCIACAQANANKTSTIKGIMCFDHKTGGTLQVVSSEQFKEYRYYAPYGRYTGRGSGIHRVTKTTSCM
jgi:hypothetical protein